MTVLLCYDTAEMGSSWMKTDIMSGGRDGSSEQQQQESSYCHCVVTIIVCMCVAESVQVRLWSCAQGVWR